MKTEKDCRQYHDKDCELYGHACMGLEECLGDFGSPTEEKAQELWDNMDASQRAGVKFGMLPQIVMQTAESYGYPIKELSVALIKIAERK
jgi:hypothetical protein